jgi:uncharacterized hydantoinase/oxoprolinase family protein
MVTARYFAVVADIVSLGNMGDRSFTQQVFDADRREQDAEALLRLAEILAHLTDKRP